MGECPHYRAAGALEAAIDKACEALRRYCSEVCGDAPADVAGTRECDQECLIRDADNGLREVRGEC